MVSMLAGDTTICNKTTGFLRDPMVALAPGSTERLLGWSYLDLGFALPTPSYFLLERIGPLDHRVVPRRRPQ